MMEPYNLDQTPSVTYDSALRGKHEAVGHAEAIILLDLADRYVQQAMADNSETRNLSVSITPDENRMTLEYCYRFSDEVMWLILRIDLSLSWLSSIPEEKLHDQFRAEIARVIRLGEIILPRILRGVLK